VIPVEFSVRIVVQLAKLEPFDVASDLTEEQLFTTCKNNTISLHSNVNCTAATIPLWRMTYCSMQVNSHLVKGHADTFINICQFMN